MSDHPLLRLDGVTVRYGDRLRPLRNVSLELEAGASLAVLGSNGAGKTTMLRAICGTLPFHKARLDQGSVWFDSQRIDQIDATKRVRLGAALVPEGRRIFKEMSVEENLLVGGIPSSGRRVRRQLLAEIYETFPILGDRRNQHASLLSGGEQQMLAIGRALMSRPKLLLLDEPSLGLAPLMIERIADVVRNVAKHGTAVLLVEQNASMALSLADRVIVLRLGEVCFEGSASSIGGAEQLRDLYLGKAGSPSSSATLAFSSSEVDQ